MPTCFFYAELMDGTGRKTEVPGELRLTRKGDGAAKFNPDSKSTVKGELHQVSAEKFKRINQSEKGTPDYESRIVRCTDGTMAQAWSYESPDWDKLRPVRSGNWRRAPGHR